MMAHNPTVKNLVFIGFRGTGKSTLSAECARILGLERISTDERITERIGCSIAEFVAAHGWAEFRRIEHEEIQALQGITSAIIDCGGGVVENPENMRLLGDLGKILWIHAALEDVVSRLLQAEQGNEQKNEHRPLLSQGTMREDIEANYTRRLPMYECYAEVCVNTSLLGVKASVEEVCELFKQKNFSR